MFSLFKQVIALISFNRTSDLRNSLATEITPNVNSIGFDLKDCTLRENGVDRRAWMNAEKGVGHLLRFNPGAPSWDFDLTDPEAASDFYRQQCQDNEGVMLSMDVIEIQGCEALRGVFKYRNPYSNGLGMLYVGILWIPFQDCDYQINVESLESGCTGQREAAVALLEPALCSNSDAPPIRATSAEELFARMRSSNVARTLSDDSRFDNKFPDHPLSKVRARLAEVEATLTFTPSMRSLKPFRVNKIH